MNVTKIEWADASWNPVTGCDPVSAGCANCYAKNMAVRLQAMGAPKYRSGFELTLHHDCLSEPLGLKNPSNVFVCSMSDLFHTKVPFNFIDLVLQVVCRCPSHRFMILTKRPERMCEYFVLRNAPIPANAWLGVTVENGEVKDRINILRTIPASVRFLSCEPLLGDLGLLNLDGIHWVIAGGESGPRARRMKPDWVESIRLQAQGRGIPFFFKQWGAFGEDGAKRSKKLNGNTLNGVRYESMPL